MSSAGEKVAIGAGIDEKKQSYWTFRVVAGNGRTFERALNRLDVPNVTRDGKLHVYGGLAVELAKQIRDRGVETMGESDVGKP